MKKGMEMSIEKIKEFRGTKFLVDKDIYKETFDTANSINNAAKTGEGISSVKYITNPYVKYILEKLEVKAGNKKTGEFNISKLKNHIFREVSFFEEVSETEEIQALPGIPEEFRFTYLKYVLNSYGKGAATNGYVKNLGNFLTVNVPKIQKAEENSNRFALAKYLGIDSEKFLEQMSKDTYECAPTIFIRNACNYINKRAKKLGLDVTAIANPTKKDWKRFGLKSPYTRGASDILIVFNDGKDIKHIHIEYFGWSGDSYNKRILEKASNIADEFEHQYAILSPNKAKTKEEADRYMDKVYEDFNRAILPNSSTGEQKQVKWVALNDKFFGETDVDAIYNGFYGCLSHLGLAHRLMPISKTELFK